MNKIAGLKTQERSYLFKETADRMNVHPIIIEKDFWVCWVLKILFNNSVLKNELIFKGGTTLSKVFSVINRFSEDIDISISKKLLGFVGDRDLENPMYSNKQRERLLNEMTIICGKYVCTTLKSVLERTFKRVLVPEESWKIIQDENDPDKLTLLFFYPTGKERLNYILPYIRIEMGCRSDFWPSEKKTVKPYCADYFEDVFDESNCSVNVLSAVRTFWEKATILHQEFYRPEEKHIPLRHSRHYYDMYMLFKSPYKVKALKELDLLVRVREHKQLFFRCGWAKYEKAKPGSFHLFPQENRLKDLTSDYKTMENMFLGNYVSFQEILSGLKTLEKEINGLQDI